MCASCDTPTLDLETKRDRMLAWADALESGEYAQTWGMLERIEPEGEAPVGFCCLGVACDIAAKAGATQRFILHGTVIKYGEQNNYAASGSDLPDDVLKYFGMNSPDGSRYHTDSLIKLNDDKKYTFAQIAEIIRREWATL